MDIILRNNKKKLNKHITGSAFGTRVSRRFTYTGKVNLRAGTNRIALLSVAVGLPVSIVCHNYYFFLFYLFFFSNSDKLLLLVEECGRTL